MPRAAGVLIVEGAYKQYALLGGLLPIGGL